MATLALEVRHTLLQLDGDVSRTQIAAAPSNIGRSPVHNHPELSSPSCRLRPKPKAQVLQQHLAQSLRMRLLVLIFVPKE